MNFTMDDLTKSHDLLKSLDPTLELVITSYDSDKSVVVLVRDTTRWSSQQWIVGAPRPIAEDLQLPLSLWNCRSIVSYFEAARKRHPESYQTCACHAHHPSRQTPGAQ